MIIALRASLRVKSSYENQHSGPGFSAADTAAAKNKPVQLGIFQRIQHHYQRLGLVVFISSSARNVTIVLFVVGSLVGILVGGGRH